jgi:alpha-beta hydrolase superfamily lysophospholipase
MFILSMMAKITPLLLALILIGGCVSQAMLSQDVTFTTTDGFKIHGTLYEADGDRAVLLLHMLNGNRHQWDSFAKDLWSDGFTVLSIDLRGHGESVIKGETNIAWTQFSDQDFNAMTLDAEAAVRYLKSLNPDARVSIIGASIGANVAITYAAQDEEVGAVVLLSPGLDYRGVKTEGAMGMYNGPVLIIASEDDAYSAESAQRLHELSPSSELKLYQNAGHGTNTLPQSSSHILAWLENTLD